MKETSKSVLNVKYWR